jgi:hypothetical protein
MATFLEGYTTFLPVINSHKDSISAKGNGINSAAVLCRSLLSGSGELGASQRLKPLANFVKTVVYVLE